MEEIRHPLMNKAVGNSLEMLISEVAKLTGLADSNIRFYEKKGLLTPARKAESGYRDYSMEDVRRLKLILLYRKMDFSIETIEALLQGKISAPEALKKQEEEKGRRFAGVEEWLDDIADYSWLTFARNTPIYGMLTLHPKLEKAFSLLFILPVVCLAEDYVFGEDRSPVLVIFWGILIFVYILGFIRFRTEKNGKDEI